MVVTGAVLFLLGTINSFSTANLLGPTEIIVEKHINPAFEKLTNYGLQSGLRPFISNFMQHGTNIFFKPQFILTPPYVAPAQGMVIESKEDCKKWPMLPVMPYAAQPQIVMEEPVKIVETIVTDSEPPVVDKVVVVKPSMPLAELPDRPNFMFPLPEPVVNFPVSSPVVFSDTPVLPPLPLIPEPIPAAPELPPLEIPQAPVDLNDPVKVPIVEVMQPAVIEEIKPIPIPDTLELPSLTVLETLVPSLPPLPEIPIPAAPELLPLELPQAPVVLDEPVEVPIIEIMQPEVKPEPKPEPVPDVEVYENHIHLPIPEAPKLPPSSPPPLPVNVILPESIKDCVRKPTLVETPVIEIHSEHVKIPDAPILPEVTLETVILPSNPSNLIEEVEPVIIPQPPVLQPPAVTLTDLMIPQPVPEVNVVEIRPVNIPHAPVLPEIPIPAAPELLPLELPPVPVVLDEPVEVPMFEIMQPEVKPEPKPEPEPEPVPNVEVYENHVHLLIPEAPKLPPYSPPPLPVPVILPESIKDCDRKPILVETPVIEIHSEHVKIPDAPILPEVIPETVTLPSNPPALIEEVEPAIIPQPPVLQPPAVTLTDLMIPQPVPEVNVVEIRPVNIPHAPVLPEIPIPAAPELLPLELPPVPVVLDEPVEVPMIEIMQPEGKPEPKPEPEPVPNLEVYENHIHLPIPEAPKLPPYSPPPLPVPVILPESIKDCNRKPTLVETPVIEIHSEHVKIPQAPILPEVIPETVILASNPPALIEVEPVIIPQPPAVTLTDLIAPQPVPEVNVVEIRPVNIPHAPVLPEFGESELPTPIIEEVKPAEPIAIPSPPELPPISMPDLPITVVVSEPKTPEVPLLVETQPVLIEEPVLQPIEIPAPPVLPPMVPAEFPDIPALPAIHDSPIIVAETSQLEQEIISNEISLAEVSESVLPAAIPQAPLLSLAAELPLPVAIEEVSVTNEVAKPVAKPLVISPAPELPHMTFQRLPVPLEEPMMSLYPPAPFPIVISQEVVGTDKIASPSLSKIESIISFPTTCVKNIVIERILPNIVREGIESSPSPKYPVLSPFSSTIGIRLF